MKWELAKPAGPASLRSESLHREEGREPHGVMRCGRFLFKADDQIQAQVWSCHAPRLWHEGTRPSPPSCPKCHSLDRECHVTGLGCSPSAHSSHGFESDAEWHSTCRCTSRRRIRADRAGLIQQGPPAGITQALSYERAKKLSCRRRIIPGTRKIDRFVLESMTDTKEWRS